MLNSHHLLIENQWLMAVRTQIFPEPLFSPCTVPHLNRQASQKSASLHKAGMWNTFISRSGLSKIPEMNSQVVGAIGKQVHRKAFKCQFYLQNPRAGLFLKVGRLESVVAVYALEKQTSKKTTKTKALLLNGPEGRQCLSTTNRRKIRYFSVIGKLDFSAMTMPRWTACQNIESRLCRRYYTAGLMLSC